MTETAPQPLELDPRAVLAELSRIPECRPWLEVAEERAARKYLQQQNAEQANELAQLREQLGDAGDG